MACRAEWVGVLPEGTGLSGAVEGGGQEVYLG